MSAGRIGLSLEGSQQATDLAEQIRQSVQVGFGGSQPTLGLLLAAPVLQDPGGVLNDAAPVLGSGVEHGVDLALGDDDVLLAAHADVGQQFLNVEQPARRSVHRVLAVTAAKQRAGDRDLVELHRKLTGRIVDGQRDLGPPEGGTRRGAGEDHVVHLLGPDGARRLGTQHPRDGIHHVGLAAPVGADHDGHPGLHLEDGRVGKRLEPLDGQTLQEHALPPIGIIRGDRTRPFPPGITPVSFAIAPP